MQAPWSKMSVICQIYPYESKSTIKIHYKVNVAHFVYSFQYYPKYTSKGQSVPSKSISNLTEPICCKIVSTTQNLLLLVQMNH